MKCMKVKLDIILLLMGVQAFLAIIYLYQQIAKDAEVLLPQFSSFYRDFEEETIAAVEPRDLLDSTDLDAPWQDDPRYIGTEVLEDVVHHDDDDDGSSSAKASLRGDSKKNVKKAASTKKKLDKPKKDKNKSQRKSDFTLGPSNSGPYFLPLEPPPSNLRSFSKASFIPSFIHST